MKKVSLKIMIILFLFMAMFIQACGGSDSTSEEEGNTGLSFVTTATFSTEAASLISGRVLTVITCGERADPSMDGPDLQDGEDCDEDGGDVMHLTPTQYAVAFKRVTLIPENSTAENIDFIVDTGTLAGSEVVTLTEDDASETIITLEPSELTAGIYTGIEMEVYYIQMTFPVSGVERHVRIYMSDDDFETEGNLGHHQGDITFIDDDGTELGWVDYTWSDNLASARGDDQNGAGGTDAETNHDRGFFGNMDFWDSENLLQGADRDIFVTTVDFELEIPEPSDITDLTTLTLIVSVENTFYYEDFAPKNTTEFPGFSPADGGEAASEEAEWAPLFPELELTSE